MAGRRILVTGHTGFKGAWLTQWLLDSGATVCGYSLPAAQSPNLFRALGLASRVEHHEGDLRDLPALTAVVSAFQPEIVFHMAAQSLVRPSFREPVDTYSVNVQGTIHLLEALRSVAIPCAAVIVTSDKCYLNREWNVPYREDDTLGGIDPYSSSKAAAEIVTSGYRSSFFGPERIIRNHISTPPVGIATARAGNVVGGGDWATDRLIPDCVRSLARGTAIPLRNPRSIRPWQHVLEPLSGYITLAADLHAAVIGRSSVLTTLAAPFNFGPRSDSCKSTRVLVEEFLSHWPGVWEDKTDPEAPHEASQLLLNSEKAESLLQWRPRWSFATTIKRTAEWYKACAADPSKAQALVRADIAAYLNSPPLYP